VIRMRSRPKRIAALAVERTLSIVAPVVVSRIAPAIPRAPRVLLIRCDHIGDAVMATAVLEPLRDALAPSRLDVLVGPWAAPLFEHHPAIDHLHVYATPWWSAARGAPQLAAWRALPEIIGAIRDARYDVGIDLRGDLRQIVFFLGLGGMPIRVSTDRTGGRSWLTHCWPYDATLHEVRKNAAIAALLGASGEPRLNVPAGPPPPIASDGRGMIVMSLRGTEPNRAWPVDHAARVAEEARAQLELATVIVGGPAERPFAEAIVAASRVPVLDLTGRTTLSETVAVFRQAKAAVTVDSGPMHLAAASGCPVVALFGPGDPRECGPWSSGARVLGRAPCGCVHPRCDYGDGPGRCMTAIEVDAVIDALTHIVHRAEAHA
jgi:ADP-heptose:LPS heptosyltransferase